MTEEERMYYEGNPGAILKSERPNRQIISTRDNSFKRIMILWYSLSIFVYVLCTAIGVALAYFVTKLIIDLNVL